MHTALWLEGAIADIFGCTSKDLSYLQLLCAAQDVPLDLLTEVRLSKLQEMCKNISAQIRSAGGMVYNSSRVSTIHQTQLTSKKSAPTTPPPSLGRRPSVPGPASSINKDYPVRVTADVPGRRRIVDCKYVVLAVPLYSLRKMEFLPAMPPQLAIPLSRRSEEHTSELQSLMRISYAVFCLKKKITQTTKLGLLIIKIKANICIDYSQIL